MNQLFAQRTKTMALASTIVMHLWDGDVRDPSVLESLELVDALLGSGEQIATVDRVFLDSDQAAADLAIKPGWVDLDMFGHLFDRVGVCGAFTTSHLLEVRYDMISVLELVHDLLRELAAATWSVVFSI